MTTVLPKHRSRFVPELSSVRIPIWLAVVCSRVLVLATGSAAALLTHPVPGWQVYDPRRLISSLGSVGGVLAAPVLRWDGVGFVSLAEHGYTSARSTVLLPLYPMLIHALSLVVRSPVIAGALISLAAFGIGLVLVHRLTCEMLGSRVADTTVLLLAFAPWSFVFSADYSTSLLLACCAATFYLARRGRFPLACLAAAAGAVTHPQGILLVAPLAVMYWKSRGRPRTWQRLWHPSVLAITAPAVALSSFFLYTELRGWGWLAPITNQNVANAGRSYIGPPATLFYTFKDAIIGLQQSFGGVAQPTGGLPLGFQNIIYLVVLTIAVLALVSTWQRLPKEYALFAALAILMCTWSAVNMEPLKGFDRYMLPIFPLWIGAAAPISRLRLAPAVLTLSTVMLIVYTFQFTRWISVF